MPGCCVAVDLRPGRALRDPRPPKGGEGGEHRRCEPGEGLAMRGPNRKIARRARQLRRNSTDAEMKLWFGLRDRRLGGFKFVRQESIGPYIGDFVCRDQKVIVEVDGGQHAESTR